MGKALIIAEKPSVAADLAKALGGFSKAGAGNMNWYERDDAVVSSGIGHLVGINFSAEDDKGWELAKLPVIASAFDLVPIKRTESQLQLLGKLLRRPDIDMVVNACDAGREGELIFRYILAYHGTKKPVKRMWLQSMTADGIREAHRSMRDASDFTGLFHSSVSRSEADLLIGANATRGLTGYHRHVFGEGELQNAGRVQTPTLAIVVDRENAIKTFVPRDYWEVHGDFKLAAGNYRGRWYRPGAKDDADPDAKPERLFTKEEAEAIVAKCQGLPPSSVTDKTVPSKAMPPQLFDLTTLQREANTKFKFSAKKTLDLAQALYEKHKALTYPRTDAKALPEDYVETAREVLGKLAGPLGTYAQKAVASGWVVPNKRIFDNSKISDHFAIIPTVSVPSGLSAEEQKIYDLVAKRFVAAFYPAAESNVTTRTTIVAGEHFESKGTVLVSPGWQEVYGRDAKDDDKRLTPMTPGEPVETLAIRAEGKQTKAPDRFTEATLLTAMETAGRLVDSAELQEAMKGKGLGTPATRAATIEGLLQTVDGKGNPKEPFLRREDNYLVPTPKAMDGVRFLRDCGIGFIASPEMTGEWEHKLGLMEKGEFSRKEFMAGIRQLATQIIETIRTTAARVPAAAAPEAKTLQTACPKCSGAVQLNKWAYQCSAGCGVKVPRELLGRAIRENEAEAILQGKAPELDGFKSPKTGKKFAAGLRFSEAFDKLDFAFAERATAPAADAKSLGACPKCAGNVFKVGDNYKCEAGTGDRRDCDFILWGEVAKKRLSEGVVAELLTKRRTEVMAGFKSSKTGKAFSARLVLGDTAKVTFEFEEK